MLAEKVLSAATSIEEVASYLDGLAPERRLDEVFSLDRGGQRRLYQMASASAPLDLDFFVPAGVGEREAVHHRGRNTLPLPAFLKRFEKRFVRPAGEAGRCFGYNESPFLPLIGPGYFVAVPTEGHEGWPKRGAVVVDYFQTPSPDAVVPAGWPRIRPNSEGLQRFVYGGTRDFMRRVSADVSIGAAYKGENALDHYFVLVRQEPTSAG